MESSEQVVSKGALEVSHSEGLDLHFKQMFQPPSLSLSEHICRSNTRSRSTSLTPIASHQCTSSDVLLNTISGVAQQIQSPQRLRLLDFCFRNFPLQKMSLKI